MSYVNHVYHIIFSTKNREPLISSGIRSDLYAYIGGIIRDTKGQLIEIGGTFDHIHVLARIHQSVPMADVIRQLKSGSSHWINENKIIAGHFSWQTKYASFTVSQTVMPKIAEYIRHQEEHHRTKTFMEEFRMFLDVHELSYDEKFLGE